MLIFTNRVVDASKTDESAFGVKFSVGGSTLGFADARRARKRGRWTLGSVHATASDTDALGALTAVFQGKLPVLVFIHGNNTSPAECFERCTHLETLYGVAVVGFSWPSEGLKPSGRRRVANDVDAAANDRWTLDGVDAGSRLRLLGVIARYGQAKSNGSDSAVAIARFLGLVGKAHDAAKKAPLSIAAHSLGAHCLQQMLAVRGVRKTLPVARNIALLAPCVPYDDHRRWIMRLPRSGTVVVTYNVTDWVLFGAFYADGGEAKLGWTVPSSLMLPAGTSRYVNFSRQAPGGHEYFDAASKKPLPPAVKDVFHRIFSSRDDIAPGQNPCNVYKGCCDPAAQVCEMK